MLLFLLRFANLLFAGLLAGAVLAVWLADNPARMGAAFYIEFQQSRIRALTLPMPLLGGLTMLSTLALAWLARGQAPLLVLTLAALACGLAGMLITIKGNFPINDLVMTWSPQAPPADWTSLRDRWWAWHCARTAVTVASFALLLAAALLPARLSAG